MLPQNKKIKSISGFTLIELMVSVSIFTMIMLMLSGSTLSVFAANKKSQNLRSVMDNLNLTLDSMSRTIRFATNYHCGTVAPTDAPRDCAVTGDSAITVMAYGGAHVTYKLHNNRIERVTCPSVGPCSPTYFMTSPDVTIDKLTFLVRGSYPYEGSGSTNALQPRITILIGGYVGQNPRTRSIFTLETVVSQRILDS